MAKVIVFVLLVSGCNSKRQSSEPIQVVERQLTAADHGHILTNTLVFSPDSNWIVYDTRPDVAGAEFTATRIERVHVQTGQIERLYESSHGAHCGVATVCPTSGLVIFIRGPEHPTATYSYGISRRQGIIVDAKNPQQVVNLDARNLVPPFVPGALRGGSHVHTFNHTGWVSFTYDDDITPQGRNIGIAIPNHPINVAKNHERNHNGAYFSVIVSQTTTTHPKPGSDDITRAFEETWIGNRGYRKADGQWQTHAIACQGLVTNANGSTQSEVFVIDLPDDPTKPGPHGPLEGSTTQFPVPPAGTFQRRVTRTAHGLATTPRHWLRTSPDGATIAFLMIDDNNVVQLWTVPTVGGEPKQITHNQLSISTAFNWTPDGKAIVHGLENQIGLTTLATEETRMLTSTTTMDLRPEAVVASPDGKTVAYLRTVGPWNQVFVVPIP